MSAEFVALLLNLKVNEAGLLSKNFIVNLAQVNRSVHTDPRRLCAAVKSKDFSKILCRLD